MATYTDEEVFSATNNTRKTYSDEEVFGPPERTVLGTAKDIGITALKGAIGVGEAVQGLADIPTKGAVGKLTEGLGYNPKEAKRVLDTYTSPAQQAANRRVEGADGFIGTLGAMVKNPSTIGHAVVESLPLMGAGGVVGRGIVAAAPKVAPWIAGAIGEGVVGAGSAAEQTRQQSETGLLTGSQSAMALASGVGTGAFNMVGGRLAQKFGFADPDTLLVQGMKKVSKEAAEEGEKGVIRRIIEGGISEGMFEEMPQSAQEQIWQNAALGKPLLDGVGGAAAAGLITGGIMGGGANLLPQGKGQPPPPVVPPEAQPPAQGQAVSPAEDPANADIERAFRGWAHTAPVQSDPGLVEWGQQIAESLLYNQTRNVPTPTVTAEQDPVVGEIERAMSPGIKAPERLPKIPPVISAPAIRSNTYGYPLSQEDEATVSDVRQSAIGERVIQGTLPDGRTAYRILDDEKQPLSPWKTFESADAGRTEIQGDTQPDRLDDGGDEGVLRGNRPGPTEEAGTVRENTIGGVAPAQQPAGNLNPAPAVADRGEQGVRVGDVAGSGASGQTGASSTVVTQGADPDLLARARQHVADTGDTSMGGMMKALDVDIDTAADLVELVKSEQPAAPSVPRNIAATSPATIANDPQAFLDERKQNLTERAEFARPVRNPGESARDFLARRKGWLNSGKVEEVRPNVAIKSVGTRPPLQSDDAIGLQGAVTEAKQDIVTDPAQVQEIKNSIVEGESILNTGEFNGKKRGVPYLNGVRKSVLSAKAKIGDTSETPEVGAHKKQQPTTPLDRTPENPGGMASSGTLRPQQPTAGSTKTGRQAKPRLAESGDDLWRKFVSTSNTGIVDKYDGILYPVAKIVGDDTEYSYHNGEVFKVSGRIGDKLVKASEREQGELHNAFTSDSVEVYSKTRWGGSGNEDIRTAKRRTTLHSPSGNSFKPQQPRPEADNGLQGKEEEVVQPPEAFNANEQVAEVNRVNPARNVNDQGEQARRGKPKNTVEFSTPIKGSKGGEIQTYRWAWKYEMQEGRDGDVEEVRASDWDNAIDNPETGRKIVHHFDIVTPEGESKTVSLESAKEILGIEGNLLTKVRQERNRQFLDEIARNRRLFRDKYTKTTYSNSGYHKTENKIYAKGYGEARAIYDEIGRLAGNKLRNPTDRAVSLLMNKHGNRLRELNEQLAPYVSDVSQPPSPQVKATPATLTKPAPKESPAPVAAAPKREGKAAAKLEDFGEKIGAARKDLWSSFKDKLADVKDADIASQPLSKIWPLPDYKAMIDGGADGLTVSIVRALRDSIPAKPKQSWRLAGWAEVAGAMRKVAVSLLEGSASTDKAISTIQGLSVTGLKDQIDLYQVVGHEKSLAGVRIAVGKYAMLDGVEYKPEKTVWSVEQEAKKTALSNWPRRMATGDTREEAIANFAKKYSELDINKPAEKQVDFVIYSTQGVDGFFVGKKIGRNYADLAGPFKTVKEARAHKTEKHDELIAKLEKYKEIPSERRDTNEPRAGVDMRGGQDVTPEMFQKAFGFRGVEFGNWVEGSRRQEDLNNAYDALMDMAAVIGIPPKAISLNGELGLAFGARGSGGINPAIAHYESTHVVINLTKKKGAGSLGHEWWHALDNYFSRMRGEKSSHMTDSLDVTLVSKDSSYIHKGAVRKAMVDAFGGVMRAVRKTAIKARSAKLDQRRSKDYWTTKPEMAARAFESYLISKLHDQNASNDYLANIVAPETWKAAEALGFELDESYPYPTAGELPVIRAAFDHLFNTIEAKPTDKGVALMSETSQPTPPAQRADISAELTSAFGRLRARLLLKRIKIVPTQDEARRIIKGIEAKLSAAFHGSPHDFEQFKMDAIGTGEGAQAYGHGLYFAGSKSVAEWYRKKLSRGGTHTDLNQKMDAITINGRPVLEEFDIERDDAFYELAKNDDNIGAKKHAESIYNLWSGLAQDKEYPFRDYAAKKEKAWEGVIQAFYSGGKISTNDKGRLYEVELAPDEQDYLLWDRPLSEQSAKVRAALGEAGVSVKEASAYDKETAEFFSDMIAGGINEGDLANDGYDPKGKEIYRRISGEKGSDITASEYLHSLGIRGIKYLDGSSRGNGDGSHNYVIFNENDVEIKVKYSDSGAIQGFFAGGNIYLVADGIAKGKAVGVAKHEITHATRLGLRQGRPWQALMRSIESRMDEDSATGEALRAARNLVPANTPAADVTEETLSYLVESGANKNLGIVRRFIAMVKRWMVNNLGINPSIFTADDFNAMAVSMLRKEAKAEFGEGIKRSVALPQTETPAFRRWFGSSKITSNGKPQVLYHGTTHPRFLKDGEYPWVFDQNRPRNPANSNLSGLGIFLGGMDAAEAHAGMDGTVHPFYVRMEKPYVTTAAELEKKVDASGAEAFRKRLQKLSGHDGIIIKDRGHAIVFGASQVKSATNNTGAFSEDKDVRYSTATVAQENLAEDYGTVTERVSDKVDLKPWERIIATAEYTLVKTPAGQRMISAAERRMMNKFQYENWILDGTMTTEMWEARQAQLPEDQRTPYAVHYQETHGGFLNTIKALAEDAKATFGEYLRNIDRTGKAFRLKNTNGWEVIDPKNKVVSLHENETEAVTAMMDAEESAMQSKGVAADIIKAVRMFREMTNRAFDMQVSDLRKIIADREELGLPPLEMSIVDESKRWAVNDRHGKVLTTYETKELAEEQLRELAKDKPGFANAKITRQSDTDITGKVTIQDYIALIGDLRGSYFPRQRQSGGVIMTAVNEKTGDRILEKFDLYVTKGKKIDPNTGAELDEGKISGLMRKGFNRFSPLGRRAEALRKQGYNVSIAKDQSMPESVFAAAQLSSSISAMLDESLARVEKGSNSPAMQSAYAEIHKTVVAGIADMFKQRGALSSRIKRAEEYYRGFEEDPVKAAVQYAKGMAGGIAKRQAAQEITLAMTGRDVSWQKFREDNPDGTWEEYSELVKQRKIDPKKQKNMYTEGMSWTEEVLRNDEQSDRIIGTLKGIAVLKYLGFRVSSAAVNMTNLVQAVPATISSISGGSIHGAMGEVTRSLKAMASYKRGNASELDKRIFSEISERGWDSAQFNHDAAAVMRSKAGNAWGKFSDAAMWMFGKAEKINRATTIHAAYKQLQKQAPSLSHPDLMDKAKHISDRAHGVYGKETAPVWTRGASNPLRMTWTFMKFSQNYMLNMGEMIGRGDYKNAAYMLLSPAILGGVGASLATPVLVALASAFGIGGDDPEEELYAWAEKQFGSDSVLRHGLPGLLGINIKGSLQANNPLPTTLEELFGAPGSILFDMRDAYRDVKRGAYSKAVEKALPTAMISPLKAYREYNEGMTTGTGTPIFYGDKPLKATEWDAAVRAFSFNPSRLSGIREKQWSETVVAKRYQDEKKDINAKIKKAFIKGNGRIDQRYWIDLAAEIEHYNERVKGVNLGDVTPITKKSIKLLRRNVTRPNKRERERQ